MENLNFFHMINSIRNKNYSLIIQNLIKEKIPCGYFCETIMNREVYPDNLYIQMKNIGINFSQICVIEKTKDDDNIISLDKFLHTPTDIKVMFISPSIWLGCFSKIFTDKGIIPLMVNNPAYITSYCNYIFEHLGEIYNTYQQLDTELSKETFLAYILGRVNYSLEEYIYSPEPQYFLHDFMVGKGDVVIDAGACDGGTSAQFSSVGARVYAFEMDEKNYKSCMKNAEKGRYIPINMGLWSFEKNERYNSNETESHLDINGDKIAHFIDLDSFVRQKNIERVDFLKMDIEGAELEALKGAKESIVRWKPKMAICAYHKTEDLWTLMQFIRSIRPDYIFAFRQYKVDGSNYFLKDEQRKILAKYGLGYQVPTHGECVLYCR